MDLELRRKQTFWETPRNLAIVLGAAVTLAGPVLGALGYKKHRSTSRPYRRPNRSPALVGLASPSRTPAR